MPETVHDIQVYLEAYEKHLKWNLFQKWKSVDVYDGPDLRIKPPPMPALIGFSKRDAVVFTDPHDEVYKLKDLAYTEAHLEGIIEERGITAHEYHDEKIHPDATAEPWKRFAHAYYRFPKSCTHSPYLSMYGFDNDSDERLLALYFQVVIDQRKLKKDYPQFPKDESDTRSEIQIDQGTFGECYGK
ncbi:unnamed protein product [Phaeothamnion confervicola]